MTVSSLLVAFAFFTEVSCVNFVDYVFYGDKKFHLCCFFEIFFLLLFYRFCWNQGYISKGSHLYNMLGILSLVGLVVCALLISFFSLLSIYFPLVPLYVHCREGEKVPRFFVYLTYHICTGFGDWFLFRNWSYSLGYNVWGTLNLASWFGIYITGNLVRVLYEWYLPPRTTITSKWDLHTLNKILFPFTQLSTLSLLVGPTILGC